MQLSSIVTVLSAAMTAAALAPRTGGSCNNNFEPVCCVADELGVIVCSVLSLLGGTCTGSSYCCETSAAPVSDTFRDAASGERGSGEADVA